MIRYTIDEERMRVNRYKSWFKSMIDQERKQAALDRLVDWVLEELRAANFRPTYSVVRPSQLGGFDTIPSWNLYGHVYLLTNGEIYNTDEHSMTLDSIDIDLNLTFDGLLALLMPGERLGFISHEVANRHWTDRLG